MLISEILDKAADLIEPEGMWGQAGGCGMHCAETAIHRVSWPAVPFKEARFFFAKHIGGGDARDIWEWNDAPERTQSEVVSKLREAAAKARSEGK